MCYLNNPENDCKTGFVFICPGRHEEKKGKPCAGQTGVNLQDALVYLNTKERKIFPHTDRYNYLITNSWTRVEYKKKTERSTPEYIEVLTKENIKRLFHEIKDLEYVVACGGHAHLAVKVCQEFLGFNGKVAFVRHTSSQALGCPKTGQRDDILREWAGTITREF